MSKWHALEEVLASHITSGWLTCFCDKKAGVMDCSHEYSASFAVTRFALDVLGEHG